MQAISSAMFQCQSSLNGYASPLNQSHRSTRTKHFSLSKALCSQAEANESTMFYASNSLSKNGGGNPVAAFDVDVSNDTIGNLGSPLGYAFYARLDLS